MRMTSQSPRLRRIAQLLVALVLLYGLSPQQSWAEEKKKQSLADYIFKIFSADTVPTAATLIPSERESIAKAEMLLEAQNCQNQTDANYVMLGIFAGARGDTEAASRYFDMAACLAPCSPLPMTMKAQVQAQAGDFGQSECTHQRAAQLGNQNSALSVNTLMDRAVVLAQQGKLDAACSNLHQAATMLRCGRGGAEAGLGWLQLGIVWADSLGDLETAHASWQWGLAAIGRRPASPAAASLKLDLTIRVADGYIARNQFDAADHQLQEAASVLFAMLPYEKAQAQFQIGSRYVVLAERRPDVTAYAERAARQLGPMTEREAPPDGTLDVHRDAALAYAKLLEQSDPQKARQLIELALRQTLEIGQANSSYQPVLTTLSPELTLRGFNPVLKTVFAGGEGRQAAPRPVAVRTAGF